MFRWLSAVDAARVNERSTNQKLLSMIMQGAFQST